MARKRSRRTKTSHPGVKLIRRTLPSGNVVWVARWREPDPADPGRLRIVSASLEKLGLSNEDARRTWAIAKSKALQVENARREALGPQAFARPWKLKDAVDEYLERAGKNLRPSTVEGYSRSLSEFKRWASGTGIKTLHDLTEYSLAELKDHLKGRRKKAAVAKGNRGEYRASGALRSVTTVNHDLLRVRIFLHDMRRKGRVPHLDRDRIADSLRSTRPPKKRPRFLRPQQVRELLSACVRHDSEVFSMTRQEKDGDLDPGSTPRYRPVGPIVMCLLLSGCRLREALELKWTYLHLDGKAPEILLPAELVKTDEDRSVDLNVTPTLALLFKSMRLKAGNDPYVFGGEGPLSATWLKAAQKRLIKQFGAPDFGPQRLRQTCATVLVCAPKIYGAGAPFLESERLGHSVVIAQTRYARALRDLPKDAETIEAALDIEDLAAAIVERAGGIVSGGKEARA